MQNSISLAHSKIILAKMCEMVDVDAKTFDFSQEDWFRQYTWTEAEQQKFVQWLGKFLKKKGYVGSGTKRGRDWGEYEAEKIVFNYGWKLKLVE